MKCIDATKLMLRRLIDGNYLITKEAILNCPTFEAEPVRYAQWVFERMDYDMNCDLAFEYSCSICNRHISVYDDSDFEPYCHCGCKMNKAIKPGGKEIDLEE